MNLRTNDFFKNNISKDNKYMTLDSQQLHMLQGALVGIMEDVIQVCKDNGLRYSLSGGSLLGAIRHNGFVPWDDDVDLDMPRKDYEKFILAFKERFNDKYWIHAPGKTPQYGALLARVRKKGTICKVQEDKYNDECGIFVDIFIVENTFDNPFLRKIHGILCTLSLGAVSCRNFYKNRHEFLKMAEGHNDVLWIFRLKVFLGLLISWLPIQTVVKIADNIFSICKNDKTKMVTIPAGRKKFSGELFLRSDYCEYIKFPFEGHEWNVPKGYKTILTRLYGDYLRIPSEEEREKHVVLDFRV